MSLRRVFCFIAVAVFVIATLAASFLVWHCRPLLRTTQISAYELDGEHALGAEIYTRLGFPNEYWIKTSSYWFVFIPDTQTVALANSYPRKRPYLSYNHDMALGVAIDFPYKVDGEYLIRNSEQVKFRFEDRYFLIVQQTPSVL